jgi:quercetin dioxygenase-like cupin family protein
LSFSQNSNNKGVVETRKFLLSVAREMCVNADSSEHKSVIDGFADDIRSAILKKQSVKTITASNELQKAGDTRLARQLIDLSDHLPWTISFRTPNAGNKISLCSFNDLFILKSYTAGLIYLDPGQAYPEHRHPPTEYYFTLSGKADWRYGGSEEYRAVSVGNLLYNNSLDLHGIRNSNTPLLAFFLLPMQPADGNSK